jgi:hypothetical protein
MEGVCVLRHAIFEENFKGRDPLHLHNGLHGFDIMYDLTLIVGTPEHPKGHKAFQVNTGLFRTASTI